MTSITTIQSLPLMSPSQAQKTVTHNQAIAQLDAMVQLAVADRDLTAPPASPATGDVHLVGGSATGSWAGMDNQVAVWDGTAWEFHLPLTGWRAYVTAEDAVAVYDGTAWQTPAQKPQTFPQLGVNGTADGTNRLTVRADASLFEGDTAGHQLKVNKTAAGDTASMVFQQGFSAHAEIGLVGDNNLSVKVSPDGTTFAQAFVVDAASGKLVAKQGVNLSPAASDPATSVDGDLWYNSTTASFRARQGGVTVDLGSGGGGGGSSLFSSAAFTLQDGSDATKQAQFDLTGLPTSSTQSYKLPPMASTLAVHSAFATRADALAWLATETVPDGTNMWIGGLEFGKLTGATAISDMPGWVPKGEIYADHFGENTAPGTTDMTAAVQAAIDYAPEFSLMGATYHLAGAGSSLLTTAAGGTRIKGRPGKTLLSGVGTNATLTKLIQQTGMLELRDLGLVCSNTRAANGVILVHQTTSGLTMINVDFDGATTYSGGVPDQVSYGIKFPDSGTADDVHVERCNFTRLVWPLGKSNTSTASQDNLKFIRNVFEGNFREDLSLNSPAAPMTNVEATGNVFRAHAGTAAGITASRMYATFSGVQGLTCSSNDFSGQIQQCIHIEFDCRRVSATDNTFDVELQQNGAFVAMSGNNVTGSNLAPQDIVVGGNQGVNTGTAAVTVGVWVYNTAYTGTPFLSGVAISDNVLDGTVYGVIVDNESGGSVRVGGNIVRNATYAFRNVGPTDLIGDNTSENCSYGVRLDAGGSLVRHSFGNNSANTHQVDRGILGLEDPSFNFGTATLAAGGVAWNRLVAGLQTMIMGRVSVYAYTGAAEYAMSESLASWDGTTEDVSPIMSKLAGDLATATLIVDEVAAVGIAAGGSGYAVGDALTIGGGTLETDGTAATATVTAVSAGAVTGVSLTGGGQYVAPPASAASTTTTGAGTGCTLNVTPGKALACKVSSAIAQDVGIQADIEGVAYVD